ncbi:MAG TPA: long-chain fatty acid--CoA ligase [Thermomicrobiales bacterium]|nr:long-chain fatty acid--CoA ligase [Thermomicrobiales bacterium]
MTVSGQPTSVDHAARTQETPRPWVSHYPAGTPESLTFPDSVIPDLLRDAAQRYPDRTAYTYYGMHISFKELDRLSSMFANRLIEHGVKKGDPVLVVLANLPQFPIAHFGIMKAGGVVAALSPLLVEREISQLAADSGARVIVALDRVWDRVGPIVERKEVDVAIVTGPHDYLPTVKRLLYPLKYRKEMIKVPHDPKAGIHAFRKFIGGASSSDPRVAIAPGDLASFQYTGGTTGLPKAAMLTHRNLIANTMQVRAWVPDLREGEETLMAILPFFHSYGVTLCLHFAAHLGATTVLVPRFEIADVMEQITKYQPTLLPGVPTLYTAINGAAENNDERQQALKSIRYCISGGAPLPREVQRRFEEITGGHLVEGYGLSESSPVTHCNPLDGRARNGTVGVPVPNTECRIVDLETRQPMPQGERGEIAVRGPQVMRGYWKRPEDTAAVLSDDGWLYTGDIGIMDEDGFFSIVDRQKDVVITGGENIYPREVEEVLYLHPKVLEAAVVGVPHPVGGQVVKAFIVARPGESLDRREVLQFCADHLAKYKIPRLIEFRESLPKAGTGKILRRALQEEEAARKPRRSRGAQADAPQSTAESESEAEELLAPPEASDDAPVRSTEDA